MKVYRPERGGDWRYALSRHIAVKQAKPLEKIFEGLAGNGRFKAAARILVLVSIASYPRAPIIHVVGPWPNASDIVFVVETQKKSEWNYLSLNVICCRILNTENKPIRTTTPYQKYLACLFPSTWNSVSSKISPRKSDAWVELEKSTPVSFSGVPDDAPPIGIVEPISILFRTASGRSMFCTTVLL